MELVLTANSVMFLLLYYIWVKEGWLNILLKFAFFVFGIANGFMAYHTYVEGMN